MSFFELFWIFIIIFSLLPAIKLRIIEGNRLRLIKSLESKRGTRLITLIHRQEMISFLGIPFFRYIDIEDSEEVLRAIRFTPDDMPIDIILHTPGGLALASEQIAHAILRHPSKVTVFIPHYAMSGGTMIALAASEIAMDENAVMGPIDPQIGELPAASILKVVKMKDINKIDDTTLAKADVAKKAIKQVEKFIYSLLEKRIGKKKAQKLSKVLTEGRWTHDYPITYEEAKKLGLQVSKEVPEEIYQLMRLYPQPTTRRPAVQYIPIPYRGKGKESPPTARRPRGKIKE